MKKRNKRPACLNCGRPLISSDNFCPSCGQENTSHVFGVKTLMADFFSNYFSFDSKLSRSTFPFLFKPGYLTKRFIEGKRVSFVHPLRLYLIISFIFFFLLSALIDSIVVENNLSLKAAFKAENPMPAQAIPKLDTLSLDPANLKKLQDAETKIQQKADSAKQGFTIGSDQNFMDVMRNDTLTDEQVMDRLDFNKKSSIQKMLVHQFRKVVHKDMDIFLPYLIKNLSIMMFLLLPVFAFYLFILYRRREPFYISHVVHALHVHAFSFMILILVVGINLLTDPRSWLSWTAFGLITLYAFFSVKKVYKQSWLRTFLKFNLLGFFYFTTLFFAILIEVGISFMLF